MNNENIQEIVKQAVAVAIAPLVAQIESIEKLLAPLGGLPKMTGKDSEMPENIKESQNIVKMIPKDILQKLGVNAIGFDPGMIWFQMTLNGGGAISVKKNEFDFRIRQRNSDGSLKSEAKASMNGLVAAISKLAE